MQRSGAQCIVARVESMASCVPGHTHVDRKLQVGYVTTWCHIPIRTNKIMFRVFCPPPMAPMLEISTYAAGSRLPPKLILAKVMAQTSFVRHQSSRRSKQLWGCLRDGDASAIKQIAAVCVTTHLGAYIQDDHKVLRKFVTNFEVLDWSHSHVHVTFMHCVQARCMYDRDVAWRS